MGYDGSGNYTRQRNFSADASAGIRILASAMDQEVDDIASAFNNVLLRDGQAAATGNIPMGGNRLINVGAPQAVNEYLRSRDFIENVPIFMSDNNTAVDTVSVSAAFFTSVSATQAPRDGTKVMIRMASHKSSAPIMRFSGHSANIHFTGGGAVDGFVSGAVYELTYSSSEGVWETYSHRLIPRTDAEIAAGVTPTNYQFIPGVFDRYGTNAIPGTTNMATAVQAAFSSGHEVRGLKDSTYYCSSTTISIPANTRASLYGVKLKTIVDGGIFLNATGDDIEIRGAEIEGQGNADLSPGEKLINFSGASAGAYKATLTLSDCYIHESEMYGVYCEFGQDIDIFNCRFDAIRHAAIGGQSVTRMRANYNVIHDIGPGSAGNSYGIFFSRTEGLGDLTSHPRPVDCEAIGNIIYDITEWEGMDTHTGERILFANNIIRNCMLGINIGPDSDNYSPRDVVVIGNVIDSDTLSADPFRAIGAGGADGSNKARNIIVKGNLIRGYGDDSNSEGAVMFQYTDGLVIADNIIENSRPGAICLLQDNDNFVVTGNSIRGVRNGVSNAAGINIRNTTQTGHVADNYIDSSAEFCMFIADTNRGVTFGNNRLITSGTKIASGVYAGEGLDLTGSVVEDAPDIADGDQHQFNITVAGAELGDQVIGISCSISTAALSLTATVTATDTLTVVLQNNTGGAVNLGSATYYGLVRKIAR